MHRISLLGLEVYPRPTGCNKWHLPVCSLLKKEELNRTIPNHPGNWEEVDFDGCPTICYVMTGKLVKSLNKERKFTAVYERFADCLGKRTVQAFFPNLWVKYHNKMVTMRNNWECHHGGTKAPCSPRNMTIRAAARFSIY